MKESREEESILSDPGFCHRHSHTRNAQSSQKSGENSKPRFKACYEIAAKQQDSFRCRKVPLVNQSINHWMYIHSVLKRFNLFMVCWRSARPMRQGNAAQARFQLHVHTPGFRAERLDLFGVARYAHRQPVNLSQ